MSGENAEGGGAGEGAGAGEEGAGEGGRSVHLGNQVLSLFCFLFLYHVVNVLNK